MTIRHLRIFVAVAELGNMHRAAERLFIAQSTVSQAIREIEENYGIKLFERLSRRIYLTETGILLLSYARHILHSVDEMEHALHHRAQLPSLRLGGSVTVGTCLLDQVIDTLNRLCPGADVFVTINNTSVVETLLLQNQLDAAVVEGIITDPELLQIPVLRDELIITAGKSHPLFQAKRLQLADLEGMDFISRETGSADRNQFEQLLSDRGIQIVRKWQCTNTEAIKNAVVRGRGLAILSRFLIEEELKKGLLKILPLTDVQVLRTLHLVYHKNKYLSPIMLALQTACAELSTRQTGQ